MKIKKPAILILSILILGIISALAFGFFEVQTLVTNERVDEKLPSSEVSKPTAPQVLAEGELRRIDAVHYGQGTVQLLQSADDASIVRFDNVTIANGPDLYVYISETANPGNTIASLGQYADLGKLKGNIGSQNYVLPDNLEFKPQSIIVWCKRFGVLFTYAEMEYAQK